MFNQMDKPQSGETIAVIHTNMGDISVRLFADLVPKTVENFVTHAKNGYYNGIIFHFVIHIPLVCFQYLRKKLYAFTLHQAQQAIPPL